MEILLIMFLVRKYLVILRIILSSPVSQNVRIEFATGSRQQ